MNFFNVTNPIGYAIPVLVGIIIVLTTIVLRELFQSRNKSSSSSSVPSSNSSSANTSSGSTEEHRRQKKDQKIIKELKRLPLHILYATTTGNAKRYAIELQKRIFTLNISGFHFDVKVTDLVNYNVELLSDEELTIFLVPTWTGGTSVLTAEPLFEHIRDFLTDFRVDRDVFKKLEYSVFALGNSEYDNNWSRAGIELDHMLNELGGERLIPVYKGDDSIDMEKQFNSYIESLIPILCEQYAMKYGEDSTDTADDDNVSSGCGTGACGPTNVSNTNGSLKQVRSWEENESLNRAKPKRNRWKPLDPNAVDNRMSVKDYRRHKRLLREQAEREADIKRRMDELRQSQSIANNNSSSINSNIESAAMLDTVETSMGDYTEEDIINDRMIAESDEMLIRMEKEERKKSKTTGIAEYVDSDDEESVPQTESFVAPSASHEGVVDLEDMGKLLQQASEERKKEEDESRSIMEAAEKARQSGLLFVPPESLREMVTPAQRRALTKEGYKIIGTHSAVKLCRWTKAQLRGRGGCYKHTFYGITSYSCMEATPSLACANKCTFCWRHGKNPVGREWRWKMDDPDMIVSEAVKNHVSMINAFKGTPGVIPERWSDAFTVRHCALSLVGEPIFYPKINELLRLLHKRKISTFLVTNAQFPEAIKTLEPVTQLYVSIDAATKETLRAIDRPLFADFWERYLASLQALRSKQQRTVYRLTLIKGQNMEQEHLQNYLELLSIGKPEFIEIKGVTYCGKSDMSTLTMANVPWHTEVRTYCEELVNRTNGEYELACAHEHSCCVLLAQKKFKIDNQWYTHINYERFQQLVQRYYASNGKETFTSMDYLAPTPSWAVYNATEAGFDPVENRWRRTKAGEVTELEYKASESGCG